MRRPHPVLMLIALAVALAAAPAGAEPFTPPTTIFGGYKTVAETEPIMRDLAARHPALATLVDIGDSWERATPGGEPGHDLLALRMAMLRRAGAVAPTPGAGGAQPSLAASALNSGRARPPVAVCKAKLPGHGD
jgi:hypothetical protein